MNSVVFVEQNGAYLGTDSFCETPRVDDFIKRRGDTYKVIQRIWRTKATETPLLCLILELQEKDDDDE